MSRSPALIFLVTVLGGCAMRHGAGDPSPLPPPVPEPPGPCDPAPCYGLGSGGCLDPEDSYMPERCGEACVDGYAQLDAFHSFCGGSSCPTSQNVVGIDGSFTDAARVEELDLEAGHVVFLQADGNRVDVYAPAAQLEGLSPGYWVMPYEEPLGSANVTYIGTEGATLAIVRAWSGLPPEGLEIFGVRVALGGERCTTPSSSPECGVDTSYDLQVSPLPVGSDVARLAPGDSVSFAVPGGGSRLVTHGQAVAWGAEACEVFAPWDLVFAIRRAL